MLKKIFGDKKRVADIILIASVLLVSLSVFIIFTVFQKDGAIARVTVDGVFVGEYSLSQDGEYSINGGTNILVIENGIVYMKYASCPDGLCINQGKKSHSGERIVCLPNRVMIDIIGDGEELIGG